MAEVEALERRVNTLSAKGVASHVTGTKRISMSDDSIVTRY